MNVSDAVSKRKSIRKFIDKPIDNEVIKELLIKSSRSASGGNLQPWRIYVINGAGMDSFLEFQNSWKKTEEPAYEIYPKNLKEPYRTSRYELGEQMYSLLGISREDKEGRISQVMENFKFFNAPAALFCYVDKQMGPPQWSDLGMFLQTFMLLSIEAGFDTCAQEAWSIKHDCVSAFLNSKDDEMLFCGMAIGYRDENSEINKLVSERRSLDSWATFI